MKPEPISLLPDSEKVRAIAFYLPQYHQVAENDEWWGTGFTEWTNVRKGEPHFPGHDQPRKPGALGYYDLTDESVLEAQAKLAREHGIHGFCFYHYRFGGGRKLLEMPLEKLLQSGRPDFPFCLCWANESWTRVWDGSDSDVLMEQTYSEEDALAFAEELVNYFKDPRYIRIGEKPLLLVYRARMLPDPIKYVNIWRQVWRDHGIGEVYLCTALTHNEQDPVGLGFDGAAEFPPHQGFFANPPNIKPPGLREDFEGYLLDYREWLSLHIALPQPSFTLFRTLVLAWDNTARLGKKATAFVNCTPALYEAWLRKVIEQTMENRPQERLIFINAWNEWAEGSYLEPDETHGLAFLKATKAALSGESRVNELVTEIASFNHCHPAIAQEIKTYLTSFDAYLNFLHHRDRLRKEEMLTTSNLRLKEKVRDKVRSCREMRAKRDSLLAQLSELHGFFSWRFLRPIFSIESNLRRRFQKNRPRIEADTNV